MTNGDGSSMAIRRDSRPCIHLSVTEGPQRAFHEPTAADVAKGGGQIGTCTCRKEMWSCRHGGADRRLASGTLWRGHISIGNGPCRRTARADSQGLGGKRQQSSDDCSTNRRHHTQTDRGMGGLVHTPRNGLANKRFAGGPEPAASLLAMVLRVRFSGGVKGVAPHKGRVRASESGR